MLAAMRWFFFLMVSATFAFAQQSPCQSKCNLAASECMKSCMGDPKDAQRKEKGEHLQDCLKQCEAQNTQCKQTCPGKP